MAPMIGPKRIAGLSPIAGLAAAVVALSSQGALAQSADDLLKTRCGACHEARADGKMTRVHEARKSPEAWDMTIVRMMVVHKVNITPPERRTLVKLLSDTQGLAPSETGKYRYILEKTPGVTDTGSSELMTQMCARCHSYARVALQRRDRADWLKLMHFHLGQYPTTEYQALGRDRDWWGIASTKVVDELAKALPYNADVWAKWKSRKAVDLAGKWRLVGRQPGKGAYSGTLTVTAKGGDRYGVTTELTFAKGGSVTRKGSAIVYSGHEWRASTRGSDGRMRQVMSMSEDGKSISGRWFHRKNDVIGGTINAVRMTGAAPQVMAVSPGYIKQGASVDVTISGVGLKGKVSFGTGTIERVIRRTAERVVVRVTATKGAKTGPRDVTVGGAKMPAGFVVYDRVAAVKVTPGQTVARVGGGGGPIPPMPAQFEAVGYMAGADGKAGTKDDVRIGVMPAKWSVSNFDDGAKAMKDAQFAGDITQGGLFNPAVAGPNPKRPKSTNNAGNLAVIATVSDGGKAIQGKAQLFVTVQRFVDPPIR